MHSLKTFLRTFPLPVAATLVALAPLPARAGVITMSATYYTIAETDQDVNILAGGVYDNEVQSSLGTDGLPILNTTTYGCSSDCFTATPLPQDLTASGEITWWSPALNNGGSMGASDITETSTGTISLPYENDNFFPPDGSGPNDENGFQAAVFSTTLEVPTTPESISFNVGADDVAFVYLDGSIVCDLGGVHGDSAGTCTSGTLSVGDHSLELFYADLHTTGAALTFNVTTADITGNPTPEPGTIALLGAGLAVLPLIRRRRA
jgi:fibro-slime domain-containing protein